MSVLHALAVIWAVGIAAATLRAIVELCDADFLWGLVAACLLIPFGCFIAAMPWAVLSGESSPDLATLKKNEWRCTDSHRESTTTFVRSGQTMIPITTSRAVCDQYARSR